MFRSPTQAGLPALSVMLADLPARPAQIARHLGITIRTLQRYLATDSAPRAVMLALFWETRWGRSAADVEAANWGALHYRAAMIERRTNQALRRQIDVLEGELVRSATGAANGPIFRLG